MVYAPGYGSRSSLIETVASSTSVCLLFRRTLEIYFNGIYLKSKPLQWRKASTYTVCKYACFVGLRNDTCGVDSDADNIMTWTCSGFSYLCREFTGYCGIKVPTMQSFDALFIDINFLINRRLAGEPRGIYNHATSPYYTVKHHCFPYCIYSL